MRAWLVPALAAALLAAACAPLPKPEAKPEAPTGAGTVALRPAAFAQLAGWTQDAHGEALAAFKKSCAKLLALPAARSVADNGAAPGGKVGDWQPACRAAQEISIADHVSARRYFETWFAPYAVANADAGADGESGLFTGYYEAELNGSWTRGGAYQTPLLARPDDLLSANLGSFDDALGGQTLWGRVAGGKFEPYPERAAIEGGALGARAKPLLWVDSPVDAFFLHVQGSGRVTLADGQVVRVGFAGKNGRPYKSIGKVLIERGEIPADRLTMDAIRAWIDTRPGEGAKLMQENPSYVFFRLVEGDGPIGAQGVALTPERSLAVDRRFLPLGAPLWLETHEPLDGAKPLNRLMIAQDTGGAIKGVVRGDYFFGAGRAAEKRAGNMKRPGRYYILLPHGVTP